MPRVPENAGRACRASDSASPAIGSVRRVRFARVPLSALSASVARRVGILGTWPTNSPSRIPRESRRENVDSGDCDRVAS
jgi:hypothetical protein